MGISGDSSQKTAVEFAVFFCSKKNQPRRCLMAKRGRKKVSAAHLMKATHHKKGRKRGGKHHSKKTITKA